MIRRFEVGTAGFGEIFWLATLSLAACSKNACASKFPLATNGTLFGKRSPLEYPFLSSLPVASLIGSVSALAGFCE